MLLAFGLIGLCAAFLLPGHYPPWVSFEQEATAAAGCGLIAIAWLARRSAGRVEVPPLALLLYACACIPLCQWAAGQIRFAVDGVLAAGYLAAFATAVVVGANGDEGWRRELADGLGLALIAAGIVSTGLATAQWLRVGSTLWVIDLPPGGRPFANLAQPNHLSTLLALAMAATLERYERQRLGGGVTALAMCWLGFGLVMTRSRTGWLFVVLLVCWWLLMRRRLGLRLPVSAVIVGAAGYAALTTGWSVLSEALLLSGETLTERLRPGTRLLHWQTLWDAIGREPWIGYGWQQVGLAQQAAVLDHPASGEWLEHSHNLLLDLLIWNGIPLGLLLAVALIVWFVRHVRVCRSTRQWALLLGVIAVFTHALLEYPLDYLYFLLPLGLMMGLLEGDTGGRTTLRLPTAVAAAARGGAIGAACLRRHGISAGTGSDPPAALHADARRLTDRRAGCNAGRPAARRATGDAPVLAGRGTAWHERIRHRLDARRRAALSDPGRAAALCAGYRDERAPRRGGVGARSSLQDAPGCPLRGRQGGLVGVPAALSGVARHRGAGSAAAVARHRCLNPAT